MATLFHLVLSSEIYHAIIAHAVSELPIECCGLLAARDSDERIRRIVKRYPLVNTAASAIEYYADPLDLLRAEKDMRAHGLTLAAIYHSHPTTHAIPSRKDIERNAFGNHVMYLIVSLQKSQPELRAWWLGENDYQEATWEIAADSNDGHGSR